MHMQAADGAYTEHGAQLLVSARACKVFDIQIAALTLQIDSCLVEVSLESTGSESDAPLTGLPRQQGSTP